MHISSEINFKLILLILLLWVIKIILIIHIYWVYWISKCGTIKESHNTWFQFHIAKWLWIKCYLYWPLEVIKFNFGNWAEHSQYNSHFQNIFAFSQWNILFPKIQVSMEQNIAISMPTLTVLISIIATLPTVWYLKIAYSYQHIIHFTHYQ